MINVNELTDVELNRAMIWLFCKKHTYIYRDEVSSITLGLRKSDGYLKSYLEDWNLTMPLAVDNELCVQFDSVTKVIDFNNGYEREHQNPLRATCEVLVQIKLEQKQ